MVQFWACISRRCGVDRPISSSRGHLNGWTAPQRLLVGGGGGGGQAVKQGITINARQASLIMLRIGRLFQRLRVIGRGLFGTARGLCPAALKPSLKSVAQPDELGHALEDGEN